MEGLLTEVAAAKNTLFILCGYPYSGKSYVVDSVAAQSKVTVVSIDELFYTQGYNWSTNELPDAAAWEQIFAESYKQLQTALQAGQTVIYDSTNHTLASRDVLRAKAAEVGADAKVVFIDTPVAVVWQRWEANKAYPQRSVVARELVQMTIDSFEVPVEIEKVITIVGKK